MKIPKQTLIIFIAAALVIAGGIYIFLPGKKPVMSPTESIATASFYDLQEKLQPLAQWKGKVMVVNFWATWCPPCIAEIPEFIKFQKQYEKQGVQFVGIAIDQRSKVQTFATEVGMNYPVLLGDLAGIDLARRIGNPSGGLPYTVIVDRNGKIVTTQLGTLSTEKLENIIKPLL
jgi:thiol-disulfide isomerase/thioredoxin